MIQVTGTITKTDGITQYVNPLLNINFSSSKKGEPIIASVEVATIINIESEPDENDMVEVREFINVIWGSKVLEMSIEIENTEFNFIQSVIKSELESRFPAATFEVV